MLFSEPANPEYADDFNRYGFFGELGIAYRSKYFIDPHLSVGYATLASGVAHLPAGEWGPAGDVEQHMGMWTLSPGITADIWRIRLRLGLGLAIINQSFSYNGTDTSVTQMPLVTEFGAGVNVVNVNRFRLDVEGRLISAPGGDINFLTIGVVARGDVIEFGR